MTVAVLRERLAEAAAPEYERWKAIHPDVHVSPRP
jgi:hypothetical protein